jgi:glycosyltransferase involved in cell wall biosynthesis
VIPTVSVVTPTWQRRWELLERCVPSVQAQTYPSVEHVVVSDGPDSDLAGRIPAGVRFEELAEHDPEARWGHWARLRGLEMATGEFIAYLDDDNAFRPRHLERLVAALDDNPDAAFAYSQMLVHPHGSIVGTDPPAYCHIDTSIIVHRRGLLDLGTWEPSLPSIDWDIVDRWMQAGAKWTFVAEVTVDYYL